MIARWRSRRFLRCLPAKIAVKRNERHGRKAGDRADHHPHEKMFVADQLLQPAAPHAGDHHPERHGAGAEGVVNGLVFAAGDVDAVQHVGGEPEAVAELLDADRGGDHPQIVGLHHREEQERRVRQMNDQRHRPEPAFQSMLRGDEPADDAADGEHDHADGAVDEADLAGGEGQAPLLARVDQERRRELDQLRLRQPIEQQEREQRQDARLAEELDERFEETAERIRRGRRRLTVGRRPRQGEEVIEANEPEQAGEDEEGRRPGEREVA